jgi:choline-sulfatase
LSALEASGLGEDTLVVYTSDHGDNLGTRTFWGKSNMYEEAVGVPLIMQGPGVPRRRRVRTPVSLVDGYPTILDAVGVPRTDAERSLPGSSLLGLAQGEDPERTVFSEYHAFASITGIFMVRFGRWKYVHYQGYRPQLYDLEADPLEQENPAEDPEYADTLERLREDVQSWMERTDDRLLEGPWPPTPEQEERVWKAPWIPGQVGH